MIWLHGCERARLSLETTVSRDINYHYDAAAQATRITVEEYWQRQNPILVRFTRK